MSLSIKHNQSTITMKISKKLLSAIAAGVLITTTYSCEKSEFGDDLHTENCTGDCSIDHSNYDWQNCPACGMG